jgi:hypothetical protein
MKDLQENVHAHNKVKAKKKVWDKHQRLRKNHSSFLLRGKGRFNGRLSIENQGTIVGKYEGFRINKCHSENAHPFRALWERPERV